jgi:hypothetical protein
VLEQYGVAWIAVIRNQNASFVAAISTNRIFTIKWRNGMGDAFREGRFGKLV